MNNTIVTVDEAIALLMRFKQSGGEKVLFSQYTDGALCIAKPISVSRSINLIENSKESIDYMENYIMKCLSMRRSETMDTLMFK